MKIKLIGLVLITIMIITLLPVQAQAATGGSTKILDCEQYKLEISNVYAMGQTSGGGSGVGITYYVVVPHGATVKLLKEAEDFRYQQLPFNEIKFTNGAVQPEIELACDYDDTNTLIKMTEGSTLTLSKNNHYFFEHSWYYNDRLYLKSIAVSIYCVDDETLVQFGGPKPAKKKVTGNILAKPTNTTFVVKSLDDTNLEYGNPKVLKQAYSINGSNYVQLRAIAMLLRGTVAEFNIGWDGQYAVIEPGKEFVGTINGSKMNNTYDVVKSTTKFKMNNEVFSFGGAYLINGDINYIQLREFAQKLNGTASQFNVYWDEIDNVAVIQPGAPYTGTKYIKPVSHSFFEKIEFDNDIIPDGKYYLKIFDKYVYPVWGGDYWLELQSSKPKNPYDIKLVENDSVNGPKYLITYDGYPVMLPKSQHGDQLQTFFNKELKYPWRIDNYNSYITIRDYRKQDLLVNAKDGSNKDKTLIIAWSHPNEVFDNAKISVYKDAENNGTSSTVTLKNLPKKVKYKLEEGFDIAGLNVVLNEGGVEINANDKVKFYTSNTEIGKGYKFVSPGIKYVQIYFDDVKLGEYKIVVAQ